MEQSLKLALENGFEFPLEARWKGATIKSIEYNYLADKVFVKFNEKEIPSMVFTYRTLTTYHKFWQALGKGLGWENTYRTRTVDYITDKQVGNHKAITEWQYQWHRFIDHLAEGKDINSFFLELTK